MPRRLWAPLSSNTPSPCNCCKWLMVAGVTIGLTAFGRAEEVDAGKWNICRVARRAMAPMEKGPLSASKLKTKPADLTAWPRRTKASFE